MSSIREGVAADEQRREVFFEIGNNRSFAAVQRRIANPRQTLIGEDLHGDEIAAGRANNDFDIGNFHRSIRWLESGRGGRRVKAEAVVNAAVARIWIGNGGEQRPCVIMRRMVHDLVGLAGLDDLAAIHHRDPVAHIADDRHVVRDEDIGQAHFVLQFHHEVEHLRT